MSNSQLLFCGSSPSFLREELTKFSNKANGGVAFRIPSIINANGTLIAAIDRASSGADWGYIEIAIRRSEDGGKSWSELEVIAAPPARETKISADCYSSGFFIDPCMAVAPNGDVIMIVDFWPECKGLHKPLILDRKKAPYAEIDGKTLSVIYDENDKPYYVNEDGGVLDSDKNVTDYRIEGLGYLYKNDEYVGNIHLYGEPGENEMGVPLTYGAPLKSPKRCYVYMMKSSDNGKTWSEPKDITGMFLNKSDGWFLGVAPGVGLTTHSGRIIMPLYAGGKGTVAIYSDDNGETWQRSEDQLYSQNTGEWQLIEAHDNTLLAFGRQKKYGKTPVSISRNNGSVWIKVKKTKIYAPSCQKSIIAVGDYVFCSHASERKRANGMLSIGKLTEQKAYRDRVEWISHKPINKGFFAYSCLVQIDEDTIGVMYESQPSSYLEFKTYKISELL